MGLGVRKLWSPSGSPMDVRAEKNTVELEQQPRRLPRIGVRMAMILAPIGIIALMIFLFSAMMASAPKPEKAPEGPQSIAVEIAAARSESTTLHVSTQGEVKPKNAAEVAARVGGQLVYISPFFEPGASVKEGEVIARIDPSEYELAVQRTRSQVSRAREALSRVEAEAKLAAEDWEELGLKGAPSDLALQKPQVASATADLRTAEAAVKEAELSLARTQIVAPFDGRVMERRADVGDFVNASAPVASIFAVNVAQVRVPLTDADLAVLGVAPGYVSQGNAAPVARLSASVAGARREWTGKLVLVDAAVNAQTRLIYGLVEVDDPFGSAHAAPLAPGLFVSIEIEGSDTQELIAFPRGALKKNEFVYVVDAEGAIWERQVHPVMTDGNDLFIRPNGVGSAAGSEAVGVKPGERVVVSYIPSPRNGMKVRDIDAPPPPPVDKAEEPAKGAKGKKASKKDAKKTEEKNP